MSPSSSGFALPTLPQAPSGPPVFGIGQMKPSRKSPQATFLSSATSQPSQANAGWKTLVGQ